jgi:hypothetical protein
MPHYFAYGLPVHSNLVIPGLSEILGDGEDACTHVVFGKLPDWLTTSDISEPQPWYISDYLDEQNQPALRVDSVNQGQHLYFRYTDGTEFVVSQDGSEIWANWPDNLTLEDTLTYLLGPIFGAILRLGGSVCLHASAVEIENRVAVFIGNSGAGKSTTAAAFAQNGYPVLSDDVVALIDLGNRFLARPAYPRIRLWKESVAALYGSADALPAIVPTNLTWDKQYLDLSQPGYCFQSKPLPIGAIYFLSERSSELTAPRIEAVEAQQQLLYLLGNTYASRFINKTMRSQEFEVLSRVTRHIPIRQIIPHRDLACLAQSNDMILDDFQKTLLARHPDSHT